MLDELVREAWFAATGWVLTAFGAVISVVFYFRARHVSSPLSYVRGSVVIDGGKRPSLLRVRVADEEIEGSIHSLRLSFWNRGRRPLERTDLVPRTPVMLRPLQDARLLDVRVVFEREPANAFAATIQPDGTCVLDFDYIARGDGVVLEVLVASKLKREHDELDSTWERRVCSQVLLVARFKTVEASAYQVHAITDTLVTWVERPLDRLKNKGLLLRFVRGVFLLAWVTTVVTLIPAVLALLILDFLRRMITHSTDRPYVGIS